MWFKASSRRLATMMLALAVGALVFQPVRAYANESMARSYGVIAGERDSSSGETFLWIRGPVEGKRPSGEEGSAEGSGQDDGQIRKSVYLPKTGDHMLCDARLSLYGCALGMALIVVAARERGDIHDKE